MLLHGHPDWEMPTERTVLFVPDTFDEAYGDEEPGMYDGMVHSQGPIVLSTRAAERGWAREDGHNVVLHELAHVFDFDGWEARQLETYDPEAEGLVVFVEGDGVAGYRVAGQPSPPEAHRASRAREN